MATKQLQQQNAQNIDLLSAYFQHRYEPNFSWRAACSMFLALPGLRGFWPMSSVDHTAAARCRDICAQGNHLGDNNTPTFNYDSLAPYVEFDGVNQYLNRADGGAGNWADILGTETYIASAARGLTIGGWFWIDQSTGSNQGLTGKWTGAGVNRSYSILYNNAGTNVQFIIASGAAQDTVTSSATLSFGQWYFVVGRYIPSTSISIFLNDGINNNAVGIPASINDTAADFTVGAAATPTNYMDGRASMVFLCTAQLDNAIILSLFEQTKAMYNVT